MIRRSIRCAFRPACGKSDRTNSLCAMNLNTRASIKGRSGSIVSIERFPKAVVDILQRRALERVAAGGKGVEVQRAMRRIHSTEEAE